MELVTERTENSVGCPPKMFSTAIFHINRVQEYLVKVVLHLLLYCMDGRSNSKFYV